jgi:tetratricopeptide (TPR) repeat protein
MLISNQPKTEKGIIVESRQVEIVIANEGATPLSLYISPLNDILEMTSLKDTHFSLKEHVENTHIQYQIDFEYELKSLERKFDKFSNSPTFLNRLANLAELSDQKETEAKFLGLAKNLSDDPFFNHRLGDNLINRNQLSDAEKLFNTLDLSKDVFANLRLAFFNIHRMDFETASIYVKQALNIDSLDYSARFLQGVLRIVDGQYELAVQSFRAANEERQGSAALYTNMAIAYLYLKKPKKALNYLKRAVNLEPFNENAVMLFSDLAFSEQCIDDSIQILKNYIEFEQKQPSVWARLARSFLFIGNTKEAIEALKRQGSIEDSSAVWNNLGVAYMKQGDNKKAYEALLHAMNKDATLRGKDYLLAAKNICQLYANIHAYNELLKFSSVILKEDNQKNLNIIKSDRILSDIIAYNLHSLWHLNKKNDIIELSKRFIHDDNVTLRLKVWIITTLIGYLALTEEGISEAMSLSEQFCFLIDKLDKKDSDRKDQLINNIAFTYVEKGHLEKAEKYLRYLTPKIHKDPYPTATFGLFSFRKGNFERGEQLYLEAIHISQDGIDKIRIRQKLNFELAKLWIDRDQRKAKRYLEKVIEPKEGSIELASRAKQLKENLLHLPSCL